MSADGTETSGFGVHPYGEGPYGGTADDGEDTESPMSTIIITSTTDEASTSYEFTIDGSGLEKNSDLGSIQGNDVIDGQTARGKVWGGTDAYSFEGSVVDFWWDGPEAPTVTIDGDVVDPETLGPTTLPVSTISVEIDGETETVVVFGASAADVTVTDGTVADPTVMLGRLPDGN